METREADCAEQSVFEGNNEWTSTKISDLLFVVEKLRQSLVGGAGDGNRTDTSLFRGRLMF